VPNHAAGLFQRPPLPAQVKTAAEAVVDANTDEATAATVSVRLKREKNRGNVFIKITFVELNEVLSW